MGVLTGLKVVDITRGAAGPLLTQLLADMGPDMVRVEFPDDRVRRQQGYQVRLRGRRGILIDPSMHGAREVLERLIRAADVLVSEPSLDGRQPVPWSWPELEAMNPRLVYCRINGYGDEGPDADRWAHDHLVAASHGVYDQPGWRDGPTYLTAPIPSLGAALLALQAIGSALYVRERTGKGQEVSTSLLAGALAYQPGMIKAAVERPLFDPGLMGRSPLGAGPFYSIYECGDGKWLHFGCLTQDFQRKAMKAIDREQELTALGFPGGGPPDPSVRENVVATITARMKEKPFSEWAAIFESQDVPHAASQWTEDLLDDPQVRHEGLVIGVNDSRAGLMEQMGPAIVFGGAPAGLPGPAPLPGQHSDEVCRELGFSPDEIASLRRAGAIL